MQRTIAFFFSTILFILFISTAVKFYIAELYYAGSKIYLDKGDLNKALEYSTKAVSLNSNEPAYLRQRAKVNLANKILLNNSELTANALTDLQNAENLNPHNLATLRNQIPLYYYLVNDSDIQITRNYFYKLKTTYKSDLGLLVDIAKYEKQLGLEQDFILTKDMISVLRPDILEWHEDLN